MLKTGTTHIERSDSRLLEHPCFNDIHSTIKKNTDMLIRFLEIKDKRNYSLTVLRG